MRGRIIKTSNGWGVTFLRKADAQKITETYEVVTLPLHPKDVNIAKHDMWVNFEVQTIAQGTSEVDVMDADVARIIG